LATRDGLPTFIQRTADHEHLLHACFPCPLYDPILIVVIGFPIEMRVDIDHNEARKIKNISYRIR
jgi:hypothetical protein